MNCISTTKHQAINLCIQNGIELTRALTFASLNRGSSRYWANPNIVLLSEPWSLLLNDRINKKLYVMRIPAYSIDVNQLSVRSDNPILIDLQIRYNDMMFVDARSGYSFKKFLVKTIDY